MVAADDTKGTTGVTPEEEDLLYTRKRRNAKIFGWILAVVVLITFATTIIVLAARGGPNPMIEPTEQYIEE